MPRVPCRAALLEPPRAVAPSVRPPLRRDEVCAPCDGVGRGGGRGGGRLTSHIECHTLTKPEEEAARRHRTGWARRGGRIVRGDILFLPETSQITTRRWQHWFGAAPGVYLCVFVSFLARPSIFFKLISVAQTA